VNEQRYLRERYISDIKQRGNAIVIDPNGGLAALPYTVIRIRAGDTSNTLAVHSGTGFFYGLKSGTNDIPLIVSNKHVLCDKTWIELDFASINADGARIFGPSTKLRVEPGQLPIFEHPDDAIDLAAIPLNPLLEALKNGGGNPHALLLGAGNFAPAHIQSILHASTSVLMVGFPNGIMDEANNLPVVRRGTLATHYVANYLGQTNFAVDIAAFGGSSGSPVFALFEHILPDENGNVSFMTQPQIHLIGVLHSGPMMTAQGIVPVPVPTNHLVSQTNIMLHLGYCVKAFRIEEIRTVVEALISTQK
jgi:Trypsin-like peptidase domain